MSTTATTRKELYNALLNAFKNEDIAFEGIDSERAIELLEKDIANLNKPRISKKEATERAQIDEQVMEVMVSANGKSVTATEIVEAIGNISVQRVVASLKRLAEAKEVKRVKDGKATLFSLVD